MWHPISIEFKNLFSHNHTLFNFKQGEMLLLLGRNGIGKSTIIEAITLAITGDVYRKVGKDDYIQEGKEETWIDFTLKNDVTKEVFRIERTVHIKNSSKLKLYENDKLLKKLADNRSFDANKYIFDKLGIVKEDFLNYFVIGQGNYNSFFGGTDAKQKEIISRFSNAAIVDRAIEKVEQEIDSLEQQIQEVISHKNNKAQLFEYLLEEIESLSKTKIAEFDLQKKQLHDTIKSCRDDVASKQKEVNSFKSEVKALRETLKINRQAINEKTICKTKEAIQKLRGRGREVKTELENWQNLSSQLSVRAGKIVQCEKCKHKFIPSSDLTVEEVKQHQVTVNEQINILGDSLKKILFDIEKLEIKKEEQEVQQDLLLEQERKFKDKVNKLNIAQERLTEYQRTLQKKLDELDNLKQPAYKAELAQKKSKAGELEAEVAKYEEQWLKLIHQKEDLLYHRYHFGRSGFKTFLANKSIKNIQDISNYYLRKFKSDEIDLQVLISGFKINKNGDIRDKIEVNIIKNGVRRGSFHKFSGGEKSRVELTGIITVHKLINNSCDTGGLDLLCLDENISYLDKEGQQEIIDILKKAGITSILVMHMQTDTNEVKAIRLQKTNDVTKLLS